MSVLDDDITEQFEQSTFGLFCKWVTLPITLLGRGDDMELPGRVYVFRRRRSEKHVLLGTKEDGCIQISVKDFDKFLSMRQSVK